jgi:hypothetical protein
MVATDVASRGIGMIDHNSPPPPPPLLSNMLSYLYLLPLTSCEHWCFSLLTVHALHAQVVQASFGPYPKGNLGLELQFALGPSGCSDYLQVSAE